jgi:hypothetical protein
MKIHLFVALSVLVTMSSHANESDVKVSCEYDEGYFDNFKTQHQPLQDLAKVVGPQLCKNVLRIDDDEVASFNKALKEYARLANVNIQQAFPEQVFTGVGDIAQLWEEQLNNYEVSFDYLTPMNFKFSDMGRDVGAKKYALRLSLPPYKQNTIQWNIDREQRKLCKNSFTDMDCNGAVESLKAAIKPAFSLLNKEILKNNGKLLGQLQSGWKAFIKDARYQTPLDVWFTTTLQSNKFHGTDLTGPPQWQAFLLRPSIVYEHINDLEKGNKDDVSLALEWVGINWWQTGIGVSVTSVYNDRPETSAVGTGFTLHIKNKYSFGYIHRKDDKGSFFFNLDLLEVFGEKKEVYKKYKEYF